jgi:WD40 repeat protein
MWDWISHKCVGVLNFPRKDANSLDLLDLHDGNVLAWSSGGMHILNLNIAAFVSSFDRPCGHIFQIALLASGHICSISFNGIEIWDRDRKSAIKRIDDLFNEKISASRCVAIHGKRDYFLLYETSSDSKNKIIAVNLCDTNFRQKTMLEEPSGVTKLNDGRILAWNRSGSLYWKSNSSGLIGEIFKFDRQVNSIAQIGHSHIMALSYAHEIAYLIDIEKKTLLRSFEWIPIRKVVPISRGRIISWGDGYILRCWDPCGHGSSVYKTFYGHEGRIKYATELSSGDVLSIGYDCTLRVWNTDSGQCRIKLDAFSAHFHGALEAMQGLVFAWTADILYLWDTSSGDTIARWKASLTGVNDLGSGRFLFCFRNSNPKIFKLNGKYIEEVFSLAGYSARMIGAYRLTDRLVAAWDVEGTVMIWDFHSGERFGECRVLNSSEFDILDDFAGVGLKSSSSTIYILEFGDKGTLKK